jgi:predicted Zn-dependent protease with MMP-like domain
LERATLGVFPLNPRLRHRFDALLEQVLAGLPEELRKLLDEVPVVVEDEPCEEVLDDVGVEEDDDLFGVHRGIPLTERSVEHSGTLPETITIYRRGILDAATDRRGRIHDDALRRQIRITVLHEIGHHFGLKEEDLRRLGYG